MTDMINHPPHYKGVAGCGRCGCEIEAIQITERHNFNRGNALKYILRAGKKGAELEDLQKARWYIEREIGRLMEGAL